MQAVLAVGLLLASLAAAADPPRVISRELCNGIWIVPLDWSSDSGKVHRLNAMFDTGGSNLFIDPDALERVSGRRIENGARVRLPGISVTGLAFDEFRPRVRELDALASAVGRDLDVFLPFRAFRHAVLVLDYPAREMRLEGGALPEVDGRTVFSARGPDRRPWLEVDLGGTSRRLLIDSGSNGRLAIKELYGLNWRTAPRPLRFSPTFGGDQLRPLGRIVETLQIANLEFGQPIVSITEDTELIGVEVLRHFRIDFDQNNRRVRFEPSPEGPLRMAAERGTGAVLRAAAGGDLEVVRVLRDTPAERAGLLPGDRIVSVDGVAASQRGCIDLDRPRREAVDYGIRRAGGTESLRVEIIDLIE